MASVARGQTTYTIERTLDVNQAYHFSGDYGIKANASGGSVRVHMYAKAYYTNGGVSDNHALLYGAYSDLNNTSTFTEKGWNLTYINNLCDYPVLGNFLCFLSGGSLHTEKSTAYKNRVMQVTRKLSKVPITFDEFAFFDTPQFQVEIELELLGTTTLQDVISVKLPGVGIISADHFNDPCEVKGSNYEITSLKEAQIWGHTDNKFEIASFNTNLANSVFTGLYDGGSGPISSYFKVKTPSDGKYLVALEKSKSMATTAFDSSTLVHSNALTIHKPGVPAATYEKVFHVYEVTKTVGTVVTFEATEDGPFIIAGNFDVRFKENEDIPITKRKLFHRADYPNDALICAHRGIWSKLGTHNPVDYAGVAENTIPAYREAMYGPLSGYIDWIEFDARRTKDGVFVSWHDDHVRRVSNFADTRECVPLEELKDRNKIKYDELAAADPEGEANSSWNFTNSRVANLNWTTTTFNGTGGTFPAMKDLHIRDYLGCKVKYPGSDGIDTNAATAYAHPLKLEDSFQWLVDQRTNGKHTIISIDYKAGLADLDDLYRLVLEKGLEGQSIITLYIGNYALQEYINEYGRDFLKQMPITPNIYEPAETTYLGIKDEHGDPVSDPAERLRRRFLEYMDMEEQGYFFPGVIYNNNYDGDVELINFSDTDDFALRMTGKKQDGTTVSGGYPYKPKWFESHYHEPFMSSIVDNNSITIPADCDPEQHLKSEICVNRFWRADIDWQINNGTTAFFSDSVESLVEYLIAKGKKTRQ